MDLTPFLRFFVRLFCAVDGDRGLVTILEDAVGEH